MQVSTSALLALLSCLSALPTLTLAGVSCFQGDPNTIQVSDLNILIDNFNTNNFQTPFPDPVFFGSFFESETTLGVVQNTAKIVITNSDPFSATHLKLADVATSIQEWIDVCCGTFSSCIPGSTTVNGDTGLALDMQIEINTDNVVP